jgi:hypothetical protein
MVSLMSKIDTLFKIINAHIQKELLYLNKGLSEFFLRVKSSNCLPFLATKSASLSATFFTSKSLGGAGTACHFQIQLIPTNEKLYMIGKHTLPNLQIFLDTLDFPLLYIPQFFIKCHWMK